MMSGICRVESAQRTAFGLEQEHLKRQSPTEAQNLRHGTCPSCHDEVTLLPISERPAAEPAAASEVPRFPTVQAISIKCHA